jgi:hypothetical protein
VPAGEVVDVIRGVVRSVGLGRVADVAEDQDRGGFGKSYGRQLAEGEVWPVPPW